LTTDMTVTCARAGLERRLRPIYVAAFLQNVGLWVPIEKLFKSTSASTTAARDVGSR